MTAKRLTQKQLREKIIDYFGSIDEASDAAMDDYLGVCKSCGEIAESVELDARNYECENCGAKAVDGLALILIGLI